MKRLIIKIKLWMGRNWSDLLISVILAITFGCMTYQGAKLIPTFILQEGHADIWFESDIPRVFENMSSRQGPNWRANVHPLFSLASYPPVFLLKNIFHFDQIIAVRTVIAFVASAWMLMLFWLIRLMGCPKLDSLIFSVLGACSAACMFFFVVPETYSFGSTTILAGLIFVLWAQHRPISFWGHVGINVLTVSMTITNGMVAIFSNAVNLPIKKALQVILSAIIVTTVLWGAQKMLFQDSGFFLNLARETRFILREEAGGPSNAILSFFFSTLVIPEIYLVADTDRPDWPGMFTQLSAPGSATSYGQYAVVLWGILLILGFIALFTSKKNEKFRLVLGLMILGQLGMHILYGFETFLYSLHFIVLLVPLAAIASLTKMRLLVLVLTLTLIPLVALNNLSQFKKCIKFLNKESSIVGVIP